MNYSKGIKTPGILILLLIITGSSCQPQEDVQPVTDIEWQTDSLDYAAIPIENVKTVLPQAGNVELIELNCVACHSLRYIQMQPKLTHKAWEKTVDKMINTFGAPVRDSVTRQAIIEYLYAIKGKR